MYVFISILIFILSLLLIGLVVIQNSKGGGLASSFSSSNQIMGVRKTTDFLDKVTWTLAGSILFLSVLITCFIPRAEATDKSEITEQVNKFLPVDPNTIAPDFGTAQPTQPDNSEQKEESIPEEK